MALADLQAALEALDLQIVSLSSTAGPSYNIDGQSEGSGSQSLLELIKARSDLAAAITAAEGPWEIEDRVIA